MLTEINVLSAESFWSLIEMIWNQWLPEGKEMDIKAVYVDGLKLVVQ